MSRYIEFRTPDEKQILVEVEDVEVRSYQGGVQKAGLRQILKNATGTIIGVAESTIDKAIEEVIAMNTQALIQAIEGLSKRPTEAEVSFGLKATGEVGNFAVAKGGVEANYNIKLSWRFSSESQDEDEK